jgi:hypothetical protein
MFVSDGRQDVVITLLYLVLWLFLIAGYVDSYRVLKSAKLSNYENIINAV